MVKKVGKYGVNSGNTFRVINNRYLRQYGANSCIVRRTMPGTNDNRSKFDTGLGDSDLKCDRVPFSLNKKGRWSLPELIKDQLINGDHGDDDFIINLVEYHKIAKEANCISVCSAQNQTQVGQRLQIKRRGYLHANNVLKRKPRFSRKERRDRLRRGLPIEEEEPEPAQVRYDVLYPSQGALAHNAKSIKYSNVSYELDCYESRRRRNRHRKRDSKNLLNEALSLMDEEIEEEEEIICDHNETFIERNAVTFDDILEHAKSLGKLVGIPSKVRRKSEEERCQSSPIDTKRRVVHVERETPDNGTENSATTHAIQSKTTVLEPVMVILPFEQVTQTALRERFDQFYVECDSFPRRFVIDISDQVSSMDKFKLYVKNVRTVNACLAITMDEDNVMNTLKDSVCKVVLNTNFCDQIERVKIETIFDYMDTNLEELIDRTVFFIETLPDYAINMHISEPSYYKMKDKQTNVEEFTQWSTSSYKADEEFLYKYFSSFDGQYKEVTEMGYEVVSYFDSVLSDKKPRTFAREEILCGICYEMIDDNIPATALISCGHWFCDCCWREHLKTSIISGSVSLPCPEYDCEKKVDPGTALSLVAIPLIMKHAKHRHDTEVERLAETRWCPNERCGRVLRVNSVNVKIAKCQCGEECCVNCLGKPHWPADCDSVKEFKQMMIDRGDVGIEPVDVLTTVVVDGKNCPHCHRFVEKNGGCPYMMCVCGKSFCWGCGKPYTPGVINHSNCYEHGFDDKHDTFERLIDPKDKLGKLKRRRWYKMALVHRVGQHPIKYQNMKVGAKCLSQKFKALLNRSANKGMAITLDFHLEGKMYQRETDKTKDFLDSLIELHREASRLVENVAVLIDLHSIDKKQINNPLQHMAMRLARLVNIIYDLFVNEAKRNVQDTMNRMQQARNHARNVIQALVKHMSREQI